MSTLGGDKPAEPLPASWSRNTSSSGPRIARIGGPSTNVPARGGGRMATLSDLRSGGGGGGPPPFLEGNDDDGDGDDDDENSGEGESWFAGGERSGISVQNPDARTPGGNVVRDLLRRAADGSQQEHALTAQATSGSSFFTGGGHTLGSDEVESTYIPDPNAPEIREEEMETAIRHLTFWRDGFTVEDSELLRYDVPENDRILNEMQSGQVRAHPAILNVLPGQPVELRVERRLDEAYKPGQGRRATPSSFFGTGNRLGAPVPGVEAASANRSAMPGSFVQASSTSEDRPRETVTTRFEVDQTQPMTSVQIRLADGTRIVCRMNLTHTVLDIRNFINASRPENLTTPYTIGTTFPNRILDDDTATIKDAGLVNSVVVQRLL